MSKEINSCAYERAFLRSIRMMMCRYVAVRRLELREAIFPFLGEAMKGLGDNQRWDL